MPLKIERKLKREAKKHGFKPKSKRFQEYVFGTLAKIKQRSKTRRRVTAI